MLQDSKSVYQLLQCNDLDGKGLEKKIQKVAEHLRGGDFRAADAKKLKGTTFYRARLDDTNRLLFQFAHHQEKKVLLLLETIRNHDYARSRFLNGASLLSKAQIESNWGDEELAETDTTALRYLNPRNTLFHFLDKPLSFDDFQETLIQTPLPLIIVGSAGSGKTALMLEKLKTYPGKVLFVTLSRFLAESARNIYFSQGFSNDNQEIEFLSFRELLESVCVPTGSELTYLDFRNWYIRQKSTFLPRDCRKIFEEIKGVITGSSAKQKSLTKQDYLNLGIKQSIFLGEERLEVYALFERLQLHMKDQNLYDLNLATFDTIEKAQAQYDYICLDEVQDFTTVQLAFVLRFLKNPELFLFCGDSNQIVHPNFFSWARVKSYFYHEEQSSKEILHILQSNYRNSLEVTQLANQLLKIKQMRFGSIDRESNYLVKSTSEFQGRVDFFKDTPRIRKELDDRTKKSTRFAVITLTDEHKIQAKQIFKTPLVFTVHEAKGLEYPNAILFNLVSAFDREFKEICEGIDKNFLDTAELGYSRNKDKSDKSIEGLKFYINALYVSITRATEGVYWVEDSAKHPLFQLLDLQTIQETVAIKDQESSLEDWQKEVTRLEQQGKSEQADAIRKNIFQQEPVPWKILQTSDIVNLIPVALNPNAFDKKTQRIVFEMAYTHRWNWLMPHLVKAKFSLAGDPQGSEMFMRRKYYAEYQKSRHPELKKLVHKHGVEFQNALGERPLAIAAKLGEVELARSLIEWGAKRDQFEPSGKTPLGTLLASTVQSPLFDTRTIEPLVKLISPSSVRLKFQERVVKIDAKNPEFALFQLLLALAPEFFLASSGQGGLGFTAASLTQLVSIFPDSLFPPWRKKQSYLSSLLSKNEMQKESQSSQVSQHSKKLFVRIQRGVYLLNPLLEIECGETWKPLLSLFPYELAATTSQDESLVANWEFVNILVKEIKKVLAKGTSNG